MKILVTGGATREPIDEVRFISNFSSGRTAATLADDFAKNGHEVIYLGGKGSLSPSHSTVATQQFEDFKDLNEKLQYFLGGESYDLVVHAAAVSDYSIDKIIQGQVQVSRDGLRKLDSGDAITLTMSPNFKIVERLKSYSRNRDIKVVAFKLTNSESKEKRDGAVFRLSLNPDIDFVVHNDFSELKVEDRRNFRIFQRQNPLWQGTELQKLSEALLTLSQDLGRSGRSL